jgi:hypothetical protein
MTQATGAEVIAQFLPHSPFVDLDVTDADGGLVAKGIVTYELG